MDGIRHEKFMTAAIEEARTAAAEGEVPVGCVIVHDEVVVGRGHNRREQEQNPLAHAELLAIGEAARTLGSWRLEDTTLYVTLEPCPMCAGAIVNSRIPLVVYGADDPKAGAARTLYRLLEDPRLNHRCEVIPGILSDECALLLKEFFITLRRG